MMSPPGPSATTSNDALALLTLLADKDRAAGVIKDYELAKQQADESLNKNNAALAKLAEERKNLDVLRADLLKREGALASSEVEITRRRSASSAEIERVRAETNARQAEVAAERVKFQAYVKERETALKTLSDGLNAIGLRQEQRELVFSMKEEKLTKDAAELASMRELVQKKISQLRNIMET